MTRILAISALSAALLLSACASSNRTGEDLASIVRAERQAVRADTKCEVPADLIGKPHSELSNRKFAVPIRVIFPGNVVTGDQIANRLNFKVDKKGIIQQITCG